MLHWLHGLSVYNACAFTFSQCLLICEQWQEIKPKLGMPWPSHRSGFQLAVHADEVRLKVFKLRQMWYLSLIKAYVYYVLIALYIQIFLYGGYFKDANSEKDPGSEKGVVHADLWVLDPRSWEWNKVKLSFMNGFWFLINPLPFFKQVCFSICFLQHN